MTGCSASADSVCDIAVSVTPGMTALTLICRSPRSAHRRRRQSRRPNSSVNGNSGLELCVAGDAVGGGVFKAAGLSSPGPASAEWADRLRDPMTITAGTITTAQKITGMSVSMTLACIAVRRMRRTPPKGKRVFASVTTVFRFHCVHLRQPANPQGGTAKLREHATLRVFRSRVCLRLRQAADYDCRGRACAVRTDDGSATTMWPRSLG